MTFSEIAKLRLYTQQIAEPSFIKPKQTVEWMGAIQAQDFAMAKWAVGLRTKNASEETVQKALDKGDIIRTHVLRPTWHFVSSADIYWMLELSAPQIIMQMKSRAKELELTQAVLNKAYTILEKALEGGKHLNRQELVPLWEKADIITNENRASHIFLYAELSGLICSGVMKNNKQTYALLEERVKKSKSLSKDEALQKLAMKYFTSHGPATLQDFKWWSGLPVKETKNAINMVKPKLHEEKINDSVYWLTKDNINKPGKTTSAFLLPAYDEFLISYKDRTAALHINHHSQTLSSNGIFYPIIVVNNKVAGTWKRTIKKDKIIIQTSFFETPVNSAKKAVLKSAEKLALFLNKEPEIEFVKH